MTINTALISVSDKTGIVEFAQELAKRDVLILSTGGTAKALGAAGIKVTEVADYTGSPEILDGRVKTLHPKIHAGLLARRDLADHMQTIQDHNIPTIDLLVVNLYPFAETIKKDNCSLADAIENIDIGGPTMLRSAAKNFGSEEGGVTVVIDPTDYSKVINEMDSNNKKTSYALRLELATKVFTHTAYYDGLITNYLSRIIEAAPEPNKAPELQLWPRVLNIQVKQEQALRYGENPHQQAAFYRDIQVGEGLLASCKQLQGKELSYNNIADADTAWECVRSISSSACVIVKHANPCGVALGANSLEAYSKAFKTDPTSAFGGIIAFNTAVDEQTAQAISQQFVEVIIAPAYSGAALGILANKKNVRVLQSHAGTAVNEFDIKRVGGGWLVQNPDTLKIGEKDVTVVTKITPSPEQMQDLLFAWNVAQFVKSNAIVYCAGGMTLGVGAGQMSRLDSARIASIKAEKAGLNLSGSAVASDAFFPFRDGLDVVAAAGATSVIQPGGSIRDQEVIDAANERGIAMVFTAVRHFRH